MSAAEAVFADFFDGARARGQRVRVGLDGAGLSILPPEQGALAWPLDSLRAVPDQAKARDLIVTSTAAPLARLVLRDPELIRAVRRSARNLGARPPVRGKARLAGWAVAALAAVALIVFVMVPVIADRLAVLLPPAGEQALGEATFEQIRDALGSEFAPVTLCDRPAGRAALDRMAARLTQITDLPYPVRVDVLDHKMVNAFALPGGRVVFFRGLIDAADDPDEVAAVLAHEIGHVVARDPTRIALRTAGSVGVLGLLLGDFAGGTVVLFLTEWLIQANYTREAEAEADAFAHDTLARAGIPPAALADMFDRLRQEYGDAEGIVAHFMTHPALGDRIAEARVQNARLTGPIRPSLSAAEWRDLQSICR